MEIVCDPPLFPGWNVTSFRPPQLTAVFIVKGTFQLHAGGTATPAAAPEPTMGDLHQADDPERSLRYASDFAPHKPKADLLLVGTCHAPGGKPVAHCRATFGCGSWSKSLIVIGPRHWKPSLVGQVMSDPEPFLKLAIAYESAFGGPGYAPNPVGRGIAEETTPEGARILRLPSIETPADLVRSPRSRPEPAGFGPIAVTWGLRAPKAGRYGGKWLKERWPWLPEDIDWTYFNAAPSDQQLAAYPKGDETLFLENLHPAHSRYESRLPGLRPRCVVEDVASGRPRYREAPLALDTLWIDMDAERLCLVWRGRLDVQSLKLDEVRTLYIAAEPLLEAPAPLERHIEELRRRLAPEIEAKPEPPPQEGDSSPSIDEKLAAIEAEFKQVEAEAARVDEQVKAALLAAGVDPAVFETAPPASQDLLKEIDAVFAEGAAAFRRSFPQSPDLAAILGPIAPPPDASAAAEPATEPLESGGWTRELVQKGVREGVDFSGKDLAGLDLSGLDLSGARFGRVRLTTAKLLEARLAGADLRDALVSGSNLSGADLTGAQLEGADFARAKLTRARLAGTQLRYTDFSGADLQEADLSDAAGKTAGFSSANLTRATFARAKLPSADFSATRMEGADLRCAELHGASFQGAKAQGVIMEGADLTRLHAGGAPDFRQGDFRGVRATDSTWTGASLDGANFSRALLARADFTGASLRKAVVHRAEARKACFSDAHLEQSEFVQTNACQASFERADLTGARMLGSNFYEAEFWQARTGDADFRRANLKGTKLA